MNKQLKILVVEDSQDDTLLLLRELKAGGYDPIHERVETAADMQAALAATSWDIIISDYSMPAFDAPGALKTLHTSGLDIPFIIVSGNVGEDLAIAAMKAGAHDYLMKGNLSRLVPAVERELREAAQRCQHRQAQEAIRKGKMEWEAVFDAVSDLIILTDHDGRIVRCNKNATEYFAKDYDELFGKKITELFCGPEASTAKVFKFPHNRTAKHDEELYCSVLKRWFNVTGYPLHVEENKPTGIVFIVKDITKRKQLESEKKIIDREILTLYAVAFRLHSKHGLEKIMGDLLFQLHNMLQIDFTGIHLMEKGILRLRASLGLTSAFETTFRILPEGSEWFKSVQLGGPFKGTKRAKEFSPELLAAANELGLRSWCAIPLKVGVDVIGCLTVATRSEKNYSEREIFLLSSIANQLAVLVENYNLYEQMKEKADELLRSKKELKENLHKVKRANVELGRLNMAKNNFIGMASHELKTPITSILGGVQFLLKYSKLQMTPEQENIFNSVYEGIIQLRKLVEDLLSISRIETQGVLLHKKKLNLMHVSRDVFDSFALPLSERQITVRIAADQQLVPVDEGFASLAVRNLLENAIKFTPDSGEIALSGRLVERAEVLAWDETLRHFYPSFLHAIGEAARFYRLDVADTGIGIPFEEQQRIFDKFYGVGDIAYHSSGTTDFMSKGSGLGLSIVRGVMDAHSGLVWVEPGAERKGSVFTLLFPLES